MQAIDPRELNGLYALAARGGIGHGIALIDFVATNADELMYLKGDELTILRDQGDNLLASCEGVIGWAKRENIQFDSLAGSSTPSPRQTALALPSFGDPTAAEPLQAGLPITCISSPSPPKPLTPALPPDEALSAPSSKHSSGISTAESDAPLRPGSPTISYGKAANSLELPKLDERAIRPVSGPFELELQPSPSIENEGKRFELLQEAAAAQPVKDDSRRRETMEELSNDATDGGPAGSHQRDSILSDVSSALGGIGGFMMGNEPSDLGTPMMEQISDIEDQDTPSLTHGSNMLSSSTSTAETPLTSAQASRRESSLTELTRRSIDRESDGAGSDDWDIYGDYARDSMYGPALRASVYAKRASRAAALARQSALPTMIPEMEKLAKTAFRPTPSVRAQQGPEPESEPEGPSLGPRAAVADRMSSFRISRAWSDDDEEHVAAFAGARMALEKAAAKREGSETSDDDSPAKAEGAIPTTESSNMISSPAIVPPRPERRRPSAIEVSDVEPGTLAELAVETPKALAVTPRTPGSAPFSGRSLAMEIRNRRRQEQQSEEQHPDDIPCSPIGAKSAQMSPIKIAASPPTASPEAHVTSPVASPDAIHQTPQQRVSISRSDSACGSPRSLGESPPLRIANASPSDTPLSPTEAQQTPPSSTSSHHTSPSTSESDDIVTPVPPTEVAFSPSQVPVVVATPAPEENEAPSEIFSPSLLASPFSLDDDDQPAKAAGSSSKASPDLSSGPGVQSPGGVFTPMASAVPSRMSPSPRTPAFNSGQVSPNWSPVPGSPVSPHGVAITRHAAEMARKTSLGQLTVVARVEADLMASKGPVPVVFMIGGPGSVVNQPSAAPVTPKSKLRIGLGPAPPSNLGPGLRTPDTGPSRGASPNGVRPISPLAATPNASTSTVNSPSPFPDIRKPTRSVTSPAPTSRSFLQSQSLGATSATVPLIASPGLQPSFLPQASMRSDMSPVPIPAAPAPSATLSQSVGPTNKEAGKAQAENNKPVGGFMRGRSKSFSATVSKAFGVKKKDGLTIDTAPPPLPLAQTAAGVSGSQAAGKRRPLVNGSVSSRDASSGLPMPSSEPKSAPMSKVSSSSSFYAPAPNSATTPTFPFHTADMSSLPPMPDRMTTRSSSTSGGRGSSKSGSKGPVLPPDVISIRPSAPPPSGRALPSPVSHKDFAEETVKADGLDFEMVQPRKKSSFVSPMKGSAGAGSGDDRQREPSLQSPSSPASNYDQIPTAASPGSVARSSPPLSGSGLLNPALKRANTQKSNLSGWSGASNSSMGHLADTDEWGFLKDVSPNPEIFQSRNEAGGHRQAEQKWLAIIGQPLDRAVGAPKKVRKLAVEAGVPGSLRGKVWEWFMTSNNTAKQPGLYHQLLDHEREQTDSRIEHDVTTAYADHSLYADPASPGQADLRHILLAHQAFSSAPYRLGTCLIAGALLIHCVAEDAFWLLRGLTNGPLKGYYSKEGDRALRVDARVLSAVIQGSEAKLSRHLRDCGVLPVDFVEKWFTQMYIRVLPWPTALRLIDAVVSEGSRYLLIAALTILTLSRERIMAMKTKQEILGYLHDLPQDALLLPETFMKACENVRLRDEDLKKLRDGVEAGGLL